VHRPIRNWAAAQGWQPGRYLAYGLVDARQLRFHHWRVQNPARHYQTQGGPGAGSRRASNICEICWLRFRWRCTRPTRRAGSLSSTRQPFNSPDESRRSAATRYTRCRHVWMQLPVRSPSSVGMRSRIENLATKRIDRNAGDDRVDARVTDVACTALLSYRPTQPRGEAVHLKLFPEKPSLPFRRVVRSIRVSGLHRTRSESARPIVSDRAAAGARRRCVQPRARLWSAPPVQRFWFRGDSIDLGL